MTPRRVCPACQRYIIFKGRYCAKCDSQIFVALILILAALSYMASL